MSNQPRIKDIAVNDTGFVFAPFSGGPFSLNSTGQYQALLKNAGLTQLQVIDRIDETRDGVITTR